MRGSLWLQALITSLLISLFFCLVGFLLWRGVAIRQIADVRANVYLMVVNVLESAPYTESMQRLERYLAESPSLANRLWIVNEDGDILARNTELPLPEHWLLIRRPKQIHEISIHTASPGFLPELTMILLDAPEPTYALISSSAKKGMILFQILLFVFILFVSISGGLATTFIYLRKMSREAQIVMASLHSGNLKARFHIHKLDGVGSLKRDFNVMASEIEKLVERQSKMDLTRKNLLQELSHDLRTPLTSLRTSVETLVAYHQQMPVAQVEEVLMVIQGELNYFVSLVENLFFISNIAEPGYRGSRGRVDISALLSAEVRARVVSGDQLRWELNCADAVIIEGDEHLLLRMIRNSLDNAARFAEAGVRIELRSYSDHIELDIADDGEGMSAEEIADFGKRRKYRGREHRSAFQVSLGLGSVIIRTIVDLHSGELIIRSCKTDPGVERGTLLGFSFPRESRPQRAKPS